MEKFVEALGNQKPKIYQILPCLVAGDAIGNHVLSLQKMFRETGFQSEVFAQSIESQMSHLAENVNSFPDDFDGILIFHYSTGDSDANRVFLKSKGKKVIIYHNITPGRYFRDYDDWLAEYLDEARDSLQTLVPHVDLAIADSSFNAQELKNLGFKKVKVFPIWHEANKFKNVPNDPMIEAEWGSAFTTFLFVGRLVPNKAQMDLVDFFGHYVAHVDPRSRLMLVGGIRCVEYRKAIEKRAHQLNVQEQVFFHENLTESQLATFYRLADCFVCASEHEGFCVPLIEAMGFDLPVMAFGSSAIPETMGDAGVVMHHKRWSKWADTADTLLFNDAIRSQVIRRQRERLKYFSAGNWMPKIQKALLDL